MAVFQFFVFGFVVACLRPLTQSGWWSLLLCKILLESAK